MKKQKFAVQHIVDWSCGEAYFAIVSGGEIVKRLRGISSWKAAGDALRAFKAAQG